MSPVFHCRGGENKVILR